MTNDWRLLSGPAAAALLLVGVAGLPLLTPGYDAVRQTVSEIGEAGSPAQAPFAGLLCAVALGLAAFAMGVGRWAGGRGLSRWPAWVIAAMAVSVAGVGVFAFPHPLHNVFGLSELIGYQAPLVLALSWRRGPGVAFSWIMAAVVWAMIVVNLAAIDRDGPVWATVGSFYGLVQRGLFAAWFGWIAGLGLILRRA